MSVKGSGIYMLSKLGLTLASSECRKGDRLSHWDLTMLKSLVELDFKDFLVSRN